MGQKHFTLNKFTLSALLLVVALAAVLGVELMKHTAASAAATPKPAVKAPASTPSDFSFTGTAGWTQGPTNQTSMALFHAIPDGCFTSAEYYTGTIDIAAELQKFSVGPAGSAGTTPGAILPVTLSTGTGPQQYQLHQYSVVGSVAGQQVMGGLELGYLQLADGYVKFQGHCNTSAQLSATIPALQAYKFDAK